MGTATPRPRLLPLLLLVAAGSLVSPSRADDAGDAVQAVIDALREGDVAAAVTGLSTATETVDLTSRTDLLHVLADRAYRFDLSRADAPLEQRRDLAAKLVGLAETAHAADGTDVRAAWALAASVVVNERLASSSDPENWRRAAALLVSAHDAEPADGESLGYAVTFLMEGACTVLDERHALTKEADAVARNALRAHPDVPALANAIATTKTWAARTLLTSNRKAARTALKSALDTLTPYARDADKRGVVASAWNEAVTTGRENDFGMRASYITRRATALGEHVALNVPRTPRWGVSDGEYDDGETFTYVTHLDRAGDVRAQLLFRRYDFGTSYRFVGPVEVNGDNAKKIAAGVTEMSEANLFEPGAKASKPGKKSIGRDFSGYRAEIAGQERGEDGRPLTLRILCMRGGRQATLTVLVYLYGEDRETGPELQSVLDSLFEPED